MAAALMAGGLLGFAAEAPAKVVGVLRRMTFGGGSSGGWLFAPWSKSVDYSREVGDGTDSSVVMAPLLWVARNFPEAPPALWRRSVTDGTEKRVFDHPMLRLMARPNAHFTAPLLWSATVIDWTVNGNAYWLIVRDTLGIPRELWYTPAALMTPKGSSTELVTHYEYRVGGGAEPLELRVVDVVHFRYGIDPDNPRKGKSPLCSVIREVFTDQEAQVFTASLLRNMGVPGVVVSPEKGSRINPDDAEVTKAYIREQFSGERRGEPLVMGGPTQIAQFGFSPEQLVLRDLRKIPEERVTAVLGVPAIVAGLGAGLDRSTFTNMSEAREMAYESNIIPAQGLLSEEIRWQLLSQWEADPFRWRCGFDLSTVRVLQSDEGSIMDRAARGLTSGVLMRSEARRAVGVEPAANGTDDVYLIAQNYAEVPQDPAKPARTFTPNSSSQGGAAGSSEPAAAAVAAALTNGGTTHV